MPLQDLIPAADQIETLDLDQLRDNLAHIETTLRELENKVRLYETELQRELRAKVDLCGGSPQCPQPESAFTLAGDALLNARREIAYKFNQTFSMAPLCRHAQKTS